MKKEKFPPKYFHNDRKRTLNSKYSTPVKVEKVEKGSATIKANLDFLKDTRINVEDLKKVQFRDKGERRQQEEEEEELEDNRTSRRDSEEGLGAELDWIDEWIGQTVVERTESTFKELREKLPLGNSEDGASGLEDALDWLNNILEDKGQEEVEGGMSQ